MLGSDEYIGENKTSGANGENGLAAGGPAKHYGADPLTYLDPVLDELAKKWPENRTVNIVCHGHSVPAGYFATPFVNTFQAYPHLLHRMIKERFPFAVANVIVTAIGGETSRTGSERFTRDVLNHRPDVVTVDYALNDRGLPLADVRSYWKRMIEEAAAQNSRVILLTGTLDRSYFYKNGDWDSLRERAQLIRELADEYSVGLADSMQAWIKRIGSDDAELVNLLSHVNHPSLEAHQLVVNELGKFFLPR